MLKIVVHGQSVLRAASDEDHATFIPDHMEEPPM
jgi:hypothetical protein